MSIKKVKGGYKVVHCHGADKGKPLSKKPKTYEEALEQHQAIEASKTRAREKKRGK